MDDFHATYPASSWTSPQFWKLWELWKTSGINWSQLVSFYTMNLRSKCTILSISSLLKPVDEMIGKEFIPASIGCNLAAKDKGFQL